MFNFSQYNVTVLRFPEFCSVCSDLNLSRRKKINILIFESQIIEMWIHLFSVQELRCVSSFFSINEY